jgi:hypothetical protein
LTNNRLGKIDSFALTQLTMIFICFCRYSKRRLIAVQIDIGDPPTYLGYHYPYQESQPKNVNPRANLMKHSEPPISSFLENAS